MASTKVANYKWAHLSIISLYHRRNDALPAVSSECCHQARDGHQPMRFACAPPPAPCGSARRVPTPVSDKCVLPTFKHSLSVKRAAVLETGPLPPQDYKSGTVCCPISDYVGCHTDSSGGYRRHFYSDSEAVAQCELFLTVLNRNILTYLHKVESLIDSPSQHLVYQSKQKR